jgi:hypothetical protein
MRPAALRQPVCFLLGEKGFSKLRADFVRFDVDNCPPLVVHSIHQLKHTNGIDGEKYRRSSVPVSGGQWKPRNKESA